MIGSTIIEEKRGIQWDRIQIRVLEKGRVHKKQNMVNNDRYH
jgi:hypothetical protein